MPYYNPPPQRVQVAPQLGYSGPAKRVQPRTVAQAVEQTAMIYRPGRMGGKYSPQQTTPGELDEQSPMSEDDSETLDGSTTVELENAEEYLGEEHMSQYSTKAAVSHYHEEPPVQSIPTMQRGGRMGRNAKASTNVDDDAILNSDDMMDLESTSVHAEPPASDPMISLQEEDNNKQTQEQQARVKWAKRKRGTQIGSLWSEEEEEPTNVQWEPRKDSRNFGSLFDAEENS